jgi:methionyl-tRNA formyltransferase
MTAPRLEDNDRSSTVHRLVMCGCHEGGVKAVEKLVDLGYSFEAFVCLTPEQASKNNVSGYFDYRPMADAMGIQTYIPKSYALTANEDQEFFQSKKFDLLIQGGWQRLFPSAVLSTLSIGAIGLHGSADFLPKGRGRSPMNWCLIEGRKRFLMHLFMIKCGIDDGDIIAVKDFDITPHDDIETLYFKYAIVYRSLLIENLPAILAGKCSSIQQNGEPTYYRKRSPQDGEVNWELMDVWEIYNMVRALKKPYPGAFATLESKSVRLWSCRPFDTRITYPSTKYGAIVERFDNRLIVNCRGGLLLIDEWERI